MESVAPAACCSIEGRDCLSPLGNKPGLLFTYLFFCLLTLWGLGMLSSRRFLLYSHPSEVALVNHCGG